jgi:hypothetical protein
MTKLSSRVPAPSPLLALLSLGIMWGPSLRAAPVVLRDRPEARITATRRLLKLERTQYDD